MQELITQSELTTFSRCEHRHDLRYNKRLTPFEEHPALSMGSAFHAGIESGSVDAALEVLRGGEPVWDRFEEDAGRVREATVTAMVEGALAHWTDWPKEQEVQFEVALRHPDTGNASKRHRLSGVFDGVWDGDHPEHPGEVVLGEWKTASMVNRDYMERLEIDFQVSTYNWAGSIKYSAPIRKTDYRIVKKPTIRQRKGETVEEFAERVRADYIDRPEHYFFQTIVRRTDEQLERWQRQAWAIHSRMLQIKNEQLPAIQNTNSCLGRGRCPYFDLCVGAVGEDAFRKLDTKHRELRSNTNGNPS